MRELFYLEYQDEFMQRLNFILRRFNETFADPASSADITPEEFRSIKQFYKGIDTALEERRSKRAINVYKYKRKLPFDNAIQELRHFKNFKRLDESEINDFCFIYNLIEIIHKDKLKESSGDAHFLVDLSTTRREAWYVGSKVMTAC